MGGALPTSHRGAQYLPQVQPILAERLARPFTHRDWFFQPKYDGHRGLLYLAPRLAFIASKRNNVLTRFQPLAERLAAELDVRSVILDGEMVPLDSEGRQDFHALLPCEGRSTMPPSICSTSTARISAGSRSGAGSGGSSDSSRP